MQDIATLARSTLEAENIRLSQQNQELQDICRYVEEDRQKIRRLAAEWQEFARYTALSYKNEVDSFSVKLKTLEDKFKALLAENEDLKEICLYFDQLGTAAADSVEPQTRAPRPAPLASKELPLHVLCALELNEQLDVGVPHFGGTASAAALSDGRPPWQGRLEELRTSDPQTCIEELEKRVERLESEKLELVKALSATHLLRALPLQEGYEHMQHALPMPVPDTECPHHLDCGHTPTMTTTPVSSSNSVEEKTTKPIRPPATIMSAVALLDLCVRLDAMGVETPGDLQEQAEATMLRMLLNIAWKKVPVLWSKDSQIK